MSEALGESSQGAPGDDQLGASEAGMVASQKSVEGEFLGFDAHDTGCHPII